MKRNETYIDLIISACKKIGEFTAGMDEVQFGNAAAAKIGYRVHPDFMPYGKVQTTWGGAHEPNHQFGGGVEASVLKGKGTVRLEELAGTVGDSTELGFDVKSSEKQSTEKHKPIFTRMVHL